MSRPMHPEVAQAWLDKMEPMMNYQREALETLAGMKTEWGVEYIGVKYGNRHISWEGSREAAEFEMKRLQHNHVEGLRLVPRYVTGVIEDE